MEDVMKVLKSVEKNKLQENDLLVAFYDLKLKTYPKCMVDTMLHGKLFGNSLGLWNNYSETTEMHGYWPLNQIVGFTVVI